MRKFFLFLFLLAGLTGLAQETGEPVHRKSSKVIAHFSDTAGIFKRILIKLVDRGYLINDKDYDAGLITTKESEMPGGFIPTVIIKAIVRDSIVQLTMSIYPRQYAWPALYSKAKNRTVLTIGWKELVTFAESLNADRLGYSN